MAASFNFYNLSTTNTISVVATVLFPMSGSFASPTVAVGTGLVNNVFGGGLLNLTVEGFVDGPPGPALLGIDGIGPGTPFSVCDDLGADPSLPEQHRRAFRRVRAGRRAWTSSR